MQTTPATKGITCKIPQDLHEQISQEIRETGSTMSKFIEQIIREHYTEVKDQGGKISMKRTMAFQIDEDLFQQIKEYLAWHEQHYHQKLSQKEFIIGLVTDALEAARAEMEADAAAQPATEDAANEDDTDASGTGAADEDTPDQPDTADAATEDDADASGTEPADEDAPDQPDTADAEPDGSTEPEMDPASEA